MPDEPAIPGHYACAWQSVKLIEGLVQFALHTGVFWSENEAYGSAMKYALGVCPPEKGWATPKVVVARITDYIEEEEADGTD